MVGHAQGLGRRGPLQPELRHHLRHVGREPGHAGGVLGQGVEAQHVPVVLDGGAAARGVDDDGVEPLAAVLGDPGADVARGLGVALALLAHVVDERPAAALAPRDHHLGAEPRQQPDRRVVDLGVERALRAARHQRDPHPPLALRRMRLRPVVRARRRHARGRHVEHGPEPRIGHQPLEGPAQARGVERQPEAARVGQDPRERPAQGTVHEGPAIGALDVGAGVIDEMHVVHARRTGRHAGEAREAPVDVENRLGVGRPVVLQHVLDEVDAAAR